MDEIDDYRPLDWGERTVPDEINGDLALQELAVVVLEDQWLLLYQSPKRHGLRQQQDQYGGGEEGKVVIKSHCQCQRERTALGNNPGGHELELNEYDIYTCQEDSCICRCVNIIGSTWRIVIGMRVARLYGSKLAVTWKSKAMVTFECDLCWEMKLLT